MGQKISPRQTRTPKNRNHAARDMILNGSKNAGPHTNKRDKRANNTKKTWEHDWDDK